MQGLDWDDLRVLLAVAEAGSFAGAARRLRVDQATVGRRVAGLQEAVGAPLFERLAARLTLTPAGERVVRAARAMEESARQLERGLASSEARVAGVVRLSAPESLASALLAPRLRALRARHPELRLELLGSAAPANLARREADVALRLFRPEEPTLVVRRLGRLAFGLYARRDLPPGPPDLLGYDDSLAATPQARWLAATYPAARVTLRTNSTMALLAAARAGAGAALLPCFLGDAAGELVRVAGPEEVPGPELWLVVHQGLQRAPRVRAAMEFAAEAVEAEREALEGRLRPRRPSGRRASRPR